MPDTPSPVRLRATGQWLTPPGNELTAISGALNAVTLIAGFMMFAAAFERSAFDRRLAAAGYPWPHLVLAKVAALALSAAAVSAYATAVTFLTLSPSRLLALFAALFCPATAVRTGRATPSSGQERCIRCHQRAGAVPVGRASERPSDS